MILDYNNIEANYNEIILVLKQLVKESKNYDEFEYHIKDDYLDGFTARLYKLIAKQYGKAYIGQIPFEERTAWIQYIDYILDHSNFLNKEIKTRCRKYFDRETFWNNITGGIF